MGSKHICKFMALDIKHIRNFSIIAHVDHGKSTLADRMLELTKTVEARKMREQVLDQMELERERGITIKMQPARMEFEKDAELYILNLIDTPGHIDFSYEVSRALKAVEGVLLLVDATQGVQAQTLTTLAMAQELDLVIIPVLSKVDSPLARISDVKKEIANLLKCEENTILETSGKSGLGVEALLNEIVKQIPPPHSGREESRDFRSLIFDFQYSSHKGIIVYIRVFDGEVKKGDKLIFSAGRESFNALEVGIFTPEEISVNSLSVGEIGYIVTGIKEAHIATVGDTLLHDKSNLESLSGYREVKPVVWASVYPESQDDFTELKQSLHRLKLSDSSLSFEEESSGVLGRGFRCGFLGMLHLEIITERLKREFDLELVVTMPSITYELEHKNGNKETIYSPIHFPENERNLTVHEPWVMLTIITPSEYISPIIQLLYEHEAITSETETFGDGRTMFLIEMPLRELMRNFFSKIKSATSGYASLSYEVVGMRPADVVRLDVLVADELMPAFSRVVSRRRLEEDAEVIVERLYRSIPRQQFAMKIQASALGRILASRKVSALKKDVTGHLYGGDITRKRKLWEKQKKGKKRLKERGKINIPHKVFLEMMRGD